MPISDITSNSAAVATPNAHAADAARRMLGAGGNAIDAAVAAALVACVMVPYQVGIGGYGGTICVYHAQKKKAISIDFDSRAPLAYKPELYTDAAKAQHGPLAVSVPAIVAGLDAILRELGTKTFAEACAPAIALAENGFPVDATLKRAMDELVQRGDAASINALLPDGKAIPVGQPWVQKDLAALLKRIAKDPASFYSGDIPKAVCSRAKEMGGILDEQDFAGYQPKVTEPVSIDYRGYTLLTPPPPAGGLTALCTLKTLEQFDLSHLTPWGAQYLELFAEATKRCWAERRQYFGDPDFVKIPIEQLLSLDAARQRAASVRQGHWAQTHPTDPSNHTVNIVAIDGQHNLVSLTLTQGDTWGSRVGIPGLGLMLGHGMSRFTYPSQERNSPNAPAPGKRVQHNMSPMVMLKDGKPYAAIGLPGGTRIVTVTGQLAASVIDFHATPAQAIKAPRVHTEGSEPLWLSAAVPKAVGDELELMGHQVKRNQGIGGAANVALDEKSSKIQIASAYGDDAVMTG